MQKVKALIEYEFEKSPILDENKVKLYVRDIIDKFTGENEVEIQVKDKDIMIVGIKNEIDKAKAALILCLEYNGLKCRFSLK